MLFRSDVDLNGRAASEMATFAKELPCRVYIEHNGKKAAADSAVQLLTLGAKAGGVLMLSADGAGDKHSVEKLDSFLHILEGE